jgi:hypothetical protein
MKLKLVFLSTFLAAASAFALSFTSDDTFQNVVGKKPFENAVHGNGPKTSSTQILYHGGPVMNQTNSVYVIYYGTFPSTTQPIINDFLLGLNGSAQYGVNETYFDSTNTTIPGTYLFLPPTLGENPSGTVYMDNYSQGAQLNTNSIPKIVTFAINQGLRADQNGVYLVVTAPDVKVAGFCNSFCAYHTSSTAIYSGLHIRYALIPDPTQRCSVCNGGIAVYGDSLTPNGDMGADTMTDDIIHELSETVTDPDINAWYTQNGEENGDLCNYVYGPTQTVSVTVHGKTATAHYNAVLNGRNFLIQLIWKNVGPGYCASN